MYAEFIITVTFQKVNPGRTGREELADERRINSGTYHVFGIYHTTVSFMASEPMERKKKET